VLAETDTDPAGKLIAAAPVNVPPLNGK